MNDGQAIVFETDDIIESFKSLTSLLVSFWQIDNDPKLPDELRQTLREIVNIITARESETDPEKRGLLFDELNKVVPADPAALELITSRIKAHRQEIADMGTLLALGYRFREPPGGLYEILPELREAVALGEEMDCLFCDPPPTKMPPGMDY